MKRERMRGALLPGNRQVELCQFPIPKPGPRQVLIQMKASTICGSDIRAIYRQHLGTGPEAYQNVICGHEPSGQIVEVGDGTKRFRRGDRVIVYHISGCGVCHDCRSGYMISCSSPSRAAYGWQRDGGMADYLLAEEKDCVALREPLTFLDGANVACGFGTSWEVLTRMGVDGKDGLLVVGLGPVGLATLMLGRALGANPVIGTDLSPERRKLAVDLGLADTVFDAEGNVLSDLYRATAERGVEVTVDCSGSPAGRLLALQSARQWGRVGFVGEGGTVSFEPSHDLMHKQITIYGSWVTSIGHMEDLVEHLVRWNLHPEHIVTHRFSLDHATDAYAVMDGGKCGKVAVEFG